VDVAAGGTAAEGRVAMAAARVATVVAEGTSSREATVVTRVSRTDINPVPAMAVVRLIDRADIR